jgi:spore maturation protein CgeB
MKILFNDIKELKAKGTACNYYSELFYALNRIHDVSFKYGHIKNLKTLGNDFDLILLGFGYTDTGTNEPLKVINDSKIPVGVFLNKEYASLDKKLSWLKNMKPNFILTVHHSYKEIEKKIKIPTHRIMWSALKNIFKKYDNKYIYDFSITGVVRNEQTNNWRRKVLNNLDKLGNIKIYKNVRLKENNYQGIVLSGKEYATKINHSKIFLATTSPSDLISTRYFECMATQKSLIITNRMNSKVFENYLLEDFNCVMFNTMDEFYEKVKYYLTHEEERLKIVNNAYKYFIENLSWDKSVFKMTSIFDNYVK